MRSASALRHQIEAVLANRIPAALSPMAVPVRTLMPTGIAGMDRLLGGFPAAAITELVGSQSSGRTTTALAYLASSTKMGSVCAWVDSADCLSPESAAASGVDLERLLWVRCGGMRHALAAADNGQTGVTLSSHPTASPARHTGGGSPHPRSEGRGMPEAITSMLQAHGGLHDPPTRREKKAIGTPGMANRPLSLRSGQREEQVNSDRLPPRRGNNLAITAHHAEPLPRLVSCTQTEAAFRKPGQAVDQALRVTDLLLQAGGFSVIVLDLGSTPAEIAWRIPLATWFRYRAACERTRVSLLLLTQHPCARSSAELVISLEAGSIRAEGRVMTGVQYRATPERTRFHEGDARVVPIRKPPQSERTGEWTSEAAWARSR